MDDIEDQIRATFQRMGMNPEKIRYQPAMDAYDITIGVEGTDERFLEGIEGYSDKPVDYKVDTTALRMICGEVDGTGMLDGKIHVQDIMSDCHFRVEVDEYE